MQQIVNCKIFANIIILHYYYNMRHFILMADIIESSGKNADNLMRSFSSAVQNANREYRKELISPLTITLGDEFQGIAGSLMAGIHLIFTLDEYLLQADEPYSLRYVLHYGEITTQVNKEQAHGMLGPGLTQARRTLEGMKKERAEVMIEGLDTDKEEQINLAFILYRSLYNDWHSKDRKTVYDFLQYHDYKKVAELHGRDNSSMWRKERSLKIHEFEVAKKLIKSLADA